jgi:hypothetical protein
MMKYKIFFIFLALFFLGSSKLTSAGFSGAAYVDNIQMTVYYTEPAAPAPSIKAYFGGGRIGAGRF